MKKIVFVLSLIAMVSIVACKNGSDADTEDPCTNDPTLPECGTTTE